MVTDLFPQLRPMQGIKKRTSKLIAVMYLRFLVLQCAFLYLRQCLMRIHDCIQHSHMVSLAVGCSDCGFMCTVNAYTS